MMGRRRRAGRMNSPDRRERIFRDQGPAVATHGRSRLDAAHGRATPSLQLAGGPQHQPCQAAPRGRRGVHPEARSTCCVGLFHDLDAFAADRCGVS